MPSTLLDGLFDKEAGVAILAGAGISLPSPSGMLKGRDFMEGILSRITPKWIGRKTLLSTIDLPTDRHRRPGELLRFEVLMHQLAQSGLDSELRVLDCLDLCDKPNEYHYLLANLIRSGCVVITTNFDRLIEIAYAQTVVKDEAPLQVKFTDADFSRNIPNPKETPILWKLHGSLSVDGKDCRKSVQATITSILSPTMNRNKRAFLEEVLRRWDLCIIGYSGWDDLDIVPVLADTFSEKQLIWVQHESDSRNFQKKSANEVRQDSGWEDDVVGRDRVFINTDSESRIIRRDDKLILLITDSLSVARRLAGVFGDDYSVPKPQESFKWSAKDYFDQWASSLSGREVSLCKFVMEILSVNPRKHAQEARAKALQRMAQLRAQTLFADQGSSKTPREAFERASQNPAGIKLADSDPREQLEALTDLFNDYLHQGKSANSRGRFVKLMELTSALMPALPPKAKASGFNLLACLAAEVGDTAGSEIMFRWAAELSRNQKEYATELAVLRTWRAFSGFPELLNRRIVELVDELGYYPLHWHDVSMKYEHFIDEHSEDLFGLARLFQTMARYSVDVGEVLGEAKARLLLGRVYLIIAQHNDLQGVGEEAFKRAVEQFIRAQELNKIIARKKLESDSAFYLNGCRQVGGRNYEDHIRPHVLKSMWK